MDKPGFDSLRAHASLGMRKLLMMVMFSSGLLAPGAWAAVDDGDVVYTARKGDTVNTLAAEFLQGRGSLAELILLNRFTNPEHVKVGMAVKLPRKYLKFKPSTAKVTRLNCNHAMRTDVVPAVTLKLGQLLSEGAVVRIPAGCQVTLTLEDDSNLRMLSGAVVQFKMLRQRVLETAPAVQVELLDGRVAVDVPRKRPGLAEQIEIRTPKSVAGVRGTEFRVAYDAGDGRSAVEVEGGSVAARGLTELFEQKVVGGEGMPISALGESLPVETLLAPPTYEGAGPQRPSGRQQLVFRGEPAAASFDLTTAQDVLLMDDLIYHGQLTSPVFSLTGLSHQATFVRWGTVSQSGLMGHLGHYGLCLGQKLKAAWRCHLAFNFTGLMKPHLKLERLSALNPDQAAEQVVIDRPVTGVNDAPFLVRYLPVGHYRWRIDYQHAGGRHVHLAGMFQLIAIRAQD